MKSHCKPCAAGKLYSGQVRKRVYIAYSGGTIGMRRTSGGYAPESGFLASQMAAMPELASERLPEYTLQEYDPLLDSSNTTPSDWWRIARDLAERYDVFDGFLVLHGTDTMAYTASALSFLLEGLDKPVVLTGSQIPLCEIRSDARDNLIASLLVAGLERIPEVCVYFGNRLLRGNRTVKVSADSLAAFDSPNCPPLGVAGIDIELRWPAILPRPSVPFRLRQPGTPKVAALRLFPGIPAEVVRNVLQPPLDGLVLETYGVGNAPDRDPALLGALQEATARGVVIVNCTQCLRGTVDMGDYVTGARLAAAGVIGGRDMTAEAALTKLFYLLGLGFPCQEVKALMQANLRGELTPAGPR
jgi:L-asparaginase